MGVDAEGAHCVGGGRAEGGWARRDGGAQLKTKGDELTAASGDLEAAKAATESVKAELEAAKAEVESAKAEVESAKAELEAAKTEADSVKADLEAKLNQAERNLTAAKSNAYIMYANADWSISNWGTYDSEDGNVKVTPAAVTGEGDYTIGLEFANESAGLAFTAIGIKNGEIDFPGYYIRLNEIRVNGEKIETAVGYTSSDDGKETRMNLYNEWVSELPSDARVFDGNIAEAKPVIGDFGVHLFGCVVARGGPQGPCARRDRARQRTCPLRFRRAETGGGPGC